MAQKQNNKRNRSNILNGPQCHEIASCDSIQMFKWPDGGIPVWNRYCCTTEQGECIAVRCSPLQSSWRLSLGPSLRSLLLRVSASPSGWWPCRHQGYYLSLRSKTSKETSPTDKGVTGTHLQQSINIKGTLQGNQQPNIS